MALGGLYYSHFTPIAFSDITDAFRENKADVVRGCRILMQQISKVRGPVFAVANPAEPTSVALLARLGWKPTGRFCDLGELLKRG